MNKEQYIEGMQKMIEGSPAERRFLSEHSFGLFVLFYFTSYFQYQVAPFHYDFFQDCEDLVDGKIREAGWVAFREAGKTSIAKLFVIWQIACKKRKYINVDSFSTENAERILFDCAFEMSNNKRLIADFGILFSRKKGGIDDIKQNRINNFVTENGIRVEAHSTQESVRGRLHLNHRPDCLILDDIENNKTRDSEAFTKQVADHLTEAMAGMAVDGFMLYLGNYLTEYGNIQKLFDRAKVDKNIRMRNVPLIINDKPAWEDKYCMTDVEAKVTGKVSIEAKKIQLGSQVFSYEMMNQPVDDSIAEFKKEHQKTIIPQEVEKMQTRNFGTIDPAYSQKDYADDVGIIINKVNRENKWHLKAWGSKMTPKELIDMMFVIWEREQLEVWGVEEGIFDLVLKTYLDEEMFKRNKFMTIEKIKHNRTKKEERIRGLLPRYEAGGIYLIDGECEKLKEQMRVFPRGVHDDVIDALAMQEQLAKPPYESNAPQYQEVKDYLTGEIIIRSVADLNLYSGLKL